MSLETIILYTIIAFVMIGIPTFLAKKSGQNPWELLFGERVNRTIFGKKKEDETSDGQPSAAKSSGPKETNSTMNDLLDTISRLTTYARKNHFRLIVPGTVTGNGTTAALAAILITRSKVVGINCFGFGGSVMAGKGEADWQQTLNGVRTTFPSPVKKNRQQKEIVQQALVQVGWPDTEAEIFGVFTSPSIRLTQTSNQNCYTKAGMLTCLCREEYLHDGGLDPAALEQALEPRVVRSKK